MEVVFLEKAEEDIVDIIKKNDPLTITEIYEKLKNKYSWPTISKYVNILEVKGIIIIKQIGVSKMVSLKEIK